MIERDVGIVCGDFDDDLAPKLHRVKNIGLVDRGDASGSRTRGLKRDMRDAGNLRLGITHRVKAFAGTLFACDAPGRTEINVAGQFADDEDVEARDNFGFHCGGIGERGPDDGGTEIGEEIKLAAEAKDCLFGTEFARECVELEIADGTEQDRIGVACGVERCRREREAVLAVGNAADIGFVESQVEAERIKHAHRFARHFGADPVTGEERDCRHEEPIGAGGLVAQGLDD